ncbi:MAG: epoxide hydrolase N-terminal domain-containing protein, partial [Acidimicrobiia bacterium]|nr:epoxide hydrolase N-terminal domain-containing protein [Acidimicrobiia bacterium]
MGAPRPGRTGQPAAARVLRLLWRSQVTDAGADIRPFHVRFPDEAIADLRRRLIEIRWPTKELVADRSQGVQLGTIQELVRYWTNNYEFDRVESRLNALPQFITEVDGVDIHFIHVRSPHENALP